MAGTLAYMFVYHNVESMKCHHLATSEVPLVRQDVLISQRGRTGMRSNTANATRRRGAPTGIARTRQGKKAVVVYLERDAARRLKILAAQNDTTLQALGVEAIDLLFRRYKEAG